MQGGQSELLTEKKGTLLQLWTNLKHSVFDVLFVVLDKTTGQNQDVTIVSLLNQSGVDYLQMMQFPFDPTVIMTWNGGQTLNNIFNFVTNIIAIDNLMPGINYNAFLGILYLIIFMIVLVILDIIYVSYSFNRKKFRFTLPLVLLAHIVPLFVTLLFIPVTEFLLNIVNCQPSENDPNLQVMSFFPTVSCFSGAHIIHASITLFFTSIFVFISTVVAMTLFQPRMTANSIAARRSSDGEVIFIINKIICQFFFSFTPFSDTWAYVALMFFPALWLFYFYHFHQPYYKKQVGKLYRIFSAYYFWTVLMLAFSQVCLLLGFHFEGSMVIWFCGLPFIGLNIAYESKSNIDNLFSSNLKFKSGEELQAHLTYVLKLIHDRKNDENANMLLVGYIQKHIQTCVEDDCPIKVKKPKKEEVLSQMEESCKLLVIQIQRMYRQGIKKFPKCTKLHISFAFFFMERLSQNAKAYEQFVMAQRASPSFVDQFIIYRFKKIIKQKLEENKDEQNDLIEVIRFDNHVTLCQEAMIYSAKLHKQFWTELREEIPNLQKLNETGGKIIEIVNNVKLNYNQVRKINSHAPEIIHNYGVYCMFIGQKMSEGKKCLAQAKRSYYQKKAQGQLGVEEGKLEVDDVNSSIVVNASAGSMGKILLVNNNFVQMSGYLKQEITQKSIEKVLPQVMMFYHEYAMNSWLSDTSRLYMQGQGNSYFRQLHKGFLRQKNDFIIPVIYRVSYSIFQQKFHVHFRHQKEFTDNLQMRMFVITDTKGVIRDISALGFSYFSLSKDNLSSSERYIDQFGISATQQELYGDGVLLRLPKKPTFRNQDTIESKMQSNKKAGSLKQTTNEGEQFFVKAERIIMPFHEQQQEEDEFMVLQTQTISSRKEVGIIFHLEKIAVEKINSRDVKMQALDQFGTDIMQMYEVDGLDDDEMNPLLQNTQKTSRQMSALARLIQEDEEEQGQERTFKDYAGRIKTYRLRNGQLKRVIEEYGTNSDYDEIDEEKSVVSPFEMQKLKNPLFVQKILTAINTNIDHREVTVLKATFTIFFILLVVVSVFNYLQVVQQLNILSADMDLNKKWTHDQFFLNELLHLNYNLSQESNTTAAMASRLRYALDYQISFDPPVDINMTTVNGSTVQLRFNQAMLWIQGYLVNYFDPEGLPSPHNLLLQNYYLSVFPELQNYSSLQQIQLHITFLFLGLVALLASIVVAIWIYYAMRIDVKCFDIILWFLDIPVPYVGYLQTNCLTYIKSHIAVKELMEKGINFHDRHLYLDDFNGHAEDTDDKFNEESKSRKTMITRYKKKTLLSRCDCGYVQLSWLLMYSMICSIVLVVGLEQASDFHRFLGNQWKAINKQFLWCSTIPNTLRQIIDNNNTYVGTLNLVAFEEQLQDNFHNPITKLNLSASRYNLLNYNEQIASIYRTVFEGDICAESMYSSADQATCKGYLDGKLQGGMSSMLTYYATMDHSRYLEVQTLQYSFANQQMLRLLDSWHDIFSSSISSRINTLTLCLSMFLIVSLIGFVILWALYLNKLNMRINQTIQMLNMIPMKMLPKGRTDIRNFFNWIIREANKNKAQDAN